MATSCSSKRHVRRLSHPQYRLIPCPLLPRSSNRLNLCAILCIIQIVDDQQLRSKPLGRSFVPSLPLSVNIHHAQSIRKARRHFPVKEVAPLPIAHSLLGLFSGPKPEIEFGVDPSTCMCRMRQISLKRRRSSSRPCLTRMRTPRGAQAKYQTNQKSARIYRGPALPASRRSYLQWRRGFRNRFVQSLVPVSIPFPLPHRARTRRSP